MYEYIVSAWNAQADEHNQYDTLSDRERIEFVLNLAGKVDKQEPVGVVGDLFHEHVILAVGFDRGAEVFIDSLPIKKQEPVAEVEHEEPDEPISWKRAKLNEAGLKLPHGTKLYTAPQPCPECVHYISEIKRHQSEIDALKVKKFARFREDECWIYQGDEEDHLESLVCPVVISPQHLIELRGKAAECEKLKAELADKGGFFCADCQDTGWLENREEGKYPCTCMTEAEPYQLLKAERDELAAQVTHWKANHASVVEQARILKERPDMPIERVKAYESWVAMAAQVEKIRAEVELIKGGAENWKGGWSGTIQACDRALALPDLSTSILNRVRAETLRKAAELVIDLGDDSSTLDARTLTIVAHSIRALAADMEAGKCQVY